MTYLPGSDGREPVALRPTQRSIVSASSVRPGNEVSIGEIWQILVRRKYVFFSSFAIATGIAILLSLILPVRYEGVGKLTVDFESSDSLGAEALAQATGVDSATKLQTQVNVLQTDALAWDVIKRLRLDQRPEAAYHKFILGPVVCLSGSSESIENITPECRRLLIDEFHTRLHVQPISRTEIIEIRYRCRSRELAATVVNTLADLYVERSFQTKYAAAMHASTWLSGQLNEVKRDAEQAERRYIDYQKKSGIIGTDEHHNVLIERLIALNQQLVIAESERIMREARNRIAANGDAEAIASILPGSTLQVLHTEEAGLKNQYAQLDAKFGEAYPRVIQVKQQLAEAQSSTRSELLRTRDRIQQEYQASLKSESLLRSEFEKQKEEAYRTNEAAIQVALLKRDVDASDELYEQLVRKLKEAGILAGLRATNVTMVDPASIPVRKVEPARGVNVLWGMVLGSMCGMALSFLLESADTTITTLTDVANFCPIPALGNVPRLNEGGSRGRTALSTSLHGSKSITTIDRPESETSDAYRSLRTALMLSIAGAPPKIFLITSSLPREGKTTTSVNTAVVFAQKNRRVLLVDGDMRRGDLRRYFNFPPNGGLSAALTGEDPAKYYIPHPELPSLLILPAGARPPKPPDLLDSDRMRELIAIWRRDFDHVIIDAPPVIGLSDSVILSTMVDAVVVVLRAGQTRRQDVSRACDILKSVDANISGAIINDLDVHGLGYYGEDASLYTHYFDGDGKKARL